MTDDLSTVKFFKTTIVKILVYFIITNLLIGAILYFFHIEGQQKGLFSSISEKTKTIGYSIENLINKGMNAGISLGEIRGMDAYLDRKLKETPELEYIVVTDMNGSVVAQTSSAPIAIRSSLMRFASDFDVASNDVQPFYIFSSYNIPVPIVLESQNDRHDGFIHLGVSIKSVQNSISDIFFDIAIILFVSLVIGFEFLRFTFRNYVILPIMDLLSGISRISSGDLSLVSSLRAKNESYNCLEKLNKLTREQGKRLYDTLTTYASLDKKNPFYALLQEYILEIKMRIKIQKDGVLQIASLAPDVESIRIIIFLVLICEGIMTTIIPSYCAQFWSSNSYFAKQFISTSPVLVFMSVVVLVLPIGSFLSAKYGFQKTIKLSLGFYILGFCIFCLFDKSLTTVLLTRLTNGIGFGMFYIAIHNYIITYTPSENRMKSYAIYTIANGAAFITGLPVGGILVDNLGFFSTFVLCIIIASIAALYSMRYIVEYHGFESQKAKLLNPLDIKKVPGVASIILCFGFPARFLYIALLPVLEPLFLDSLGNSISVIGRVMMIFGILMFCLAPVSYKIVELFKKPANAVYVSTSLAVVALLYQFYFPTTVGVAISIFIFSVGSIVQISAMMAMLELAAAESGQEEARVTAIAMYFTYERMAMVVGPFVSSILISYVGYQKTLLTFAVFLASTATLYYFINFKVNKKSLQGA